MKKGIIYITLALALILVSFKIYDTFSGTSKMDYSIILNKKTVSKGTEITVYQNGKERTFLVPKNIAIKPAPAYKLEVKDKNVTSITPVEYSSGKILSMNDSEIHLENKTLKTTNLTKYYKIDGNSISEISDRSLIVGYQGYRFLMDKKDNVKIVLCSIPKLNRIRTLISSNDYSTINHNEIQFSFSAEAEIKSKDLNYKFVPNDGLIAKKEGNSISFSLLKNGATSLIGKSSSRVQLIQGEASKIAITSNKRQNDYVPSYYGSFEILLNGENMNLINEAYTDDYLNGVVPSEMPPSGGLEGYKIQAVISRTIAYQYINSREYANLGAHIVDSKKCQLYESAPSSAQSSEAIKSTSSEIISYKNGIIDAKYYPSSPGFRASYEDVFGMVTPTKDYLNAMVFNENHKNIKLDNEEEITNYLKDWTAKSYDSNAQLYRWKYSIDYAKLSKTINGNIYNLYKKNPNDFKIKSTFFFEKDANIGKDGLGKIQDISVSKRTSSGLLSEIRIKSDIGTFNISGEETLKKLLIPAEDFELTAIFGKPITGLTSLPSLFFTIEKNMTEDKFKSITIYGGGEGHGVGLSQYAAIGLSRAGKNYKDVLLYFYPETKIVNLDKEFRLEVENRKA